MLNFSAETFPHNSYAAIYGVCRHSHTLLFFFVHQSSLKSHCLLSFFFSCVSDPDRLSGWHDGEVWDLGHGRPGAIPQPGTHVLPGSTGRHRSLRHHQRGTFMPSHFYFTRFYSLLFVATYVACSSAQNVQLLNEGNCIWGEKRETQRTGELLTKGHFPDSTRMSP